MFRQVIPDIRLSRPSLEGTPPGPRDQNAQYLTTPHPLWRRKTPSQMDLDRHKANDESGLLSSLQTYGIPVYDFRVIQAENGLGKATLTASNVLPGDLKEYYRWGFYETIFMAGEEALAPLGGFKNFRYLYHFTAMDVGPLPQLQLPDDWRNAKTDDGILEMLLILLKRDFVPPKPPFDFCPRTRIANIPYPGPRVTEHEMSKCGENKALGIEWTMMKISAYPGRASCSSELDVERHTGSMLAGFFNIANCSTTSNKDLAFPTAIGCFGSFPRPDFACRSKISSKSNGNCPVPWAFRPLVLVGEAKIAFPAPLSSNLACQNRVAAQLACAAQPTLILMIVDAMNKWKTVKERNPQAKFSFPFNSFIHGIAYDGKGVVVYGFFPRVTNFNKEGVPSQWGFACVVVTTVFAQVFVQNRNLRMTFIAFLLSIQRHATYLADKLRNLQLSQVFTKCDKLWEVMGLGCHPSTSQS